MKFKEVKIGQRFKKFCKYENKNIDCIKISNDQYFYNNSFHVVLDLDGEVDLVSKCENCKHYGVLSGDCPVGPIEYYYVNTDEFSCSFFEERN